MIIHRFCSIFYISYTVYTYMGSLSLEGVECEVARMPHSKPSFHRSPAVTVHIHVAVTIAQDGGLQEVGRVTNV